MNDAGVLKPELISEEDYLAGEEMEIPHEYIDGRVFAMPVPTDTHGEISGNVLAPLHTHLRAKRCRAWIGNMRLRIAYLNRTIHYIPDVLIACDDPPRDRRFREYPLAVFEVLSESTEAIDQREKLLAYTTLPMLRHYFIVRQDRIEISHLRRAEARWEEFIFNNSAQEIVIPEIDFRLSLGDIYSGTQG